jgi:hypothetical protein
VTAHHLVPRSVQLTPQERKHYLRSTGLHHPLNWNKTVDLCWDCHCDLHRSFSNDVLAARLNTADRLLEWKSWKSSGCEFRQAVKEPVREFAVHDKGRSFKLFY